jgi:hypothetical protein
MSEFNCSENCDIRPSSGTGIAKCLHSVNPSCGDPHRICVVYGAMHSESVTGVVFGAKSSSPLRAVFYCIAFDERSVRGWASRTVWLPCNFAQAVCKPLFNGMGATQSVRQTAFRGQMQASVAGRNSHSELLWYA